MMVYIGMVVFCFLGVGSATKQKDYEDALDSALKNAKIRDLFKPLDVRDFRENLTITKILEVPPYDQFVHKIRTALPGKPVDLRYIFLAHNVGKPADFVCTTTIYEFNEGGDYFYILPSGRHIKCEDYQNEEQASEAPENKRWRRVKRVKRRKRKSSGSKKLTVRPNPYKTRSGFAMTLLKEPEELKKTHSIPLPNPPPAWGDGAKAMKITKKIPEKKDEKISEGQKNLKVSE